ncbi:MAG: GNAT family N-acetyltransferase [Chthoniobacterales bacterium]|nr:GNAT family N-acetyltransferase [Chthoniobacterales bacterium]
MHHAISRAGLEDLDVLADLAGKYHAFEGIPSSREARVAALGPLLADDSLGAIFLSGDRDRATGYIAVCLGYSIEFGGRDAFVDELFVEAGCRGRGLGRALLEHAAGFLKGKGIAAVTLEVAHANPRGADFYEKIGFVKREQYFLMSRKLR